MGRPSPKARPAARTTLLTAVVLVACLVMAAAPVVQAQAPQAQIRTEVVIPGQSLEQTADGFVKGKVRDLADYIGVIYAFLISIVGAVAAVMMMIGGFQYLTAGGSGERAKGAREKIANALIGLILALASFVILNTINPALVNLRVPTIKQVTAEKLDTSKILGGDLGTPCKTDADCRSPYSCVEVKEAPLSKGIKHFVEGLGVLVSIPTGAAGLAAKGALAAVKATTVGTGQIAYKVAMIFSGTRLIAIPAALVAGTGGAAAAGAAGYVAWQEIADLGFIGVCMTEADKEVPKGGLCSKDKHCKQGLTCRKDPGIQNICVDCGYCGDGGAGSFCLPGSVPCKSGLKCVDSADGVHFCSSGAQGDHCNSDGDCKNDTVCKLHGTVIGGLKKCTTRYLSGIWGECVTNADCEPGGEKGIIFGRTYTAANPRISCLIPANNPNCSSDKPRLRCVCAAAPPNLAPQNAGDGFPCYKDNDCAKGYDCIDRENNLPIREGLAQALGKCRKK